MTTFEERRHDLYSKLCKLAKTGNKEMVKLYEVIGCGTFDHTKVTHPAFQSNNWAGAVVQDYNYMLNFVYAIAIAENNAKRPSYPNIDKFPEVMREYTFSHSDRRIAVKWSTLLDKLKRLCFLPEDFDVNAAAEFIGNNWPADDVYTFEVRQNVNQVYQLEKLGSCMYGTKYPKWYDENPDAVNVVVIYLNDEYIGRALLWNATNLETGEQVKYLDRVYPSDGGAHTRALRTWAENNGYLFKDRDDMSSEERYDLEVIMTVPTHGYPYMDTFKYASFVFNDATDEQQVRLITCGDGNYDEILDNTDGTGLGDDREECSCCGDRYNEDDLSGVYVRRWDIELYCPDCLTEQTTLVTRGVLADEYVANNLIIGLAGGETATDYDDYFICPVDGERYLDEDMVETVGGTYVCEHNAKYLANGDAFIESERKAHYIVDDAGEYRYLVDMLGEFEDTEYDTDDEELLSFVWERMDQGHTFESALSAWETRDTIGMPARLDEKEVA